MRVRHLQTYLREQKCVRLGNLSVCKGMRLGIDAVYFFKTLKPLNDPLSDAYSSLSPSFVTTLEEQLKLMQSLELQPLFVFQGIQPKSHMLLSAQMIGFTMHDGWVAYVKGEETLALNKFSQNLYKEFSEDTIQFLMSYLKSKGHEMIRAPYLASSQLLYFMQEGLIDAVVGPPSTLLFGVPRVIMGLDLSKGNFEWVELDEVMNLWGIDREQFIDCCLLAGTEHCLSYPLVNQPFSFSNSIDCIKQAPLIKYLYQLPTRDRLNEYIDGYCVAKSLINYPLVMTLSGDVTSLSKTDLLPSDYHKIVGCKLPKSVYYLLSEGLLSVQLPFALALGEWVDEPNQNADSLEYRDLLSDLREYQCRALGLLVLRLDEQFKTKHIKFPRYVSLMKTPYPVKQPAKLLIPNTCQVKNWNVTKEKVEAEMRRQNVNNVSLEFCLNWHNYHGFQLIDLNTNNFNYLNNVNNHVNDSNIVNNDKGTEDFLVLNTLLHFMLLENLGYFTNELGSTAFGRVLSNSGLGMEGLLLLELMKFGLFTGDPFEAPPDCPYAHELQFHPKNEDSRKIYTTVNLASRVATFSPVKTDGKLWVGKIDFDVASFNMVTKFLRRSINYLTEGALAFLVLGDTNRFTYLKDSAFDPLKPKLPLFFNNSSFLGVIVKCVLLDTSNHYDTGNVNANLENLSKSFPNCTHLRNDLNEFISFWAKVHSLLHNLSYLIQLGEVLEYFDNATLLLKNKFDKLGLETATLNKLLT